jgi:superfamily I DNA/RNA helicase
MKENYKILGYKENFTILDSDDTLSVIKKILKDLNLDPKLYNPKAIKSKISGAKNELMNSYEYEKYGFNLVKETEPNKFYFKVNENKLFLDSGENEEEMLRNNYRIIYDYGNLEMIRI